jgi:porphobilinogen synthase
MNYPVTRLRRLRANPQIRNLVQENQVNIQDLIYPLFVCEGKSIRKEIPSMPGIFQFSIDNIVKECEELSRLDIPGVLLFGIPAHKDHVGTDSYADEGIIQRAVRAIRESVSDLLIITDICLCEYTDHGHCGNIVSGDVDNDTTLDLLSRQALSHAKAGAGMLAPSAMMDGMVSSIRNTLDQNGFSGLPIMSYSAKFASSFYGPFREAAESSPQFGDRKSYQMNGTNAREALREIEQDIKEGADIAMVKPALAYLDIIRQARDNFNIPLAAYNVSGEYSMIKAAAARGWINEDQIVIEVLNSIKRAGADIIISYFAKDVASRLNNY